MPNTNFGLLPPIGHDRGYGVAFRARCRMPWGIGTQSNLACCFNAAFIA
jgi:hypothetical protein